MFVAFDKLTRTRITSIDQEWSGRLAELRDWVRSERLICPGCEQPLWLRVGQLRRRHFAHRQLADCPMGGDSAEVMEVKAQLYEWLSSKYPGKVALDIDLAITGWKKPADLMLTREAGRFIYFVFDRQQRWREALLLWRANSRESVHFIHTQTTHKPELHSQNLILSASQRDLIEESDYNTPIRPAGGHLYFMDGERSKLSIYRGLNCIHRPNLYSWKIHRHDFLSKALIRPSTGEILFNGDIETQKSWVDEKARRKQKAEVRQRKAEMRKEVKPPSYREEEIKPMVAREAEDNADELEEADESDVSLATDAPEVLEEAAALDFKGPFRCEDCGEETMDWSSATPGARTCVCKGCSRKRWLLAQQQPPKKKRGFRSS